MINNRQNGRRRGRGGGQRPPNSAPNPGNRQDNRSRGNAAQLYEKYKAMARDAQLAGDRVQTEYYLQFADHYFRVLNETRARFEDQRRPRDDYMSDEDEDQDQDQDQDEAVNASDGRGEAGQSRRHEERFQGVEEQPEHASAESAREQRHGGERRPRRERPRRDRNGDAQEAPGEERISLEALPPAIATDDGDLPAKAPRRRTRRPRSEGGEAEIAPAA